MKGKIFLDTNILIYLQNALEPQKQAHCRAVMKALNHKVQWVLSTQVIQEFYVVLTKKLGADPFETKNIIQIFEEFEIAEIDVHCINTAIDISVLNQISFLDSLIISAAKKSKSPVVFSEDLNNRQMIGGIKIVNPLTLDPHEL